VDNNDKIAILIDCVSDGESPTRPDKTYYRVQESVESVGYGREDQATQTDDEDIYDPYPEPDDSPFKVRAVRPTNFNYEGFHDQVRSQEELNRRNTLLGSIYDLQEESDSGYERKAYLCKSGSLGPCVPEGRPRPRSKSQARECQSSNYLNGLNSQERKIVILKPFSLLT